MMEVYFYVFRQLPIYDLVDSFLVLFGNLELAIILINLALG